MFDNFYWNMEDFRNRIKGYPGMENIHEELEIAYIGERISPLIVSPFDNCVATVWYSAYLAQKIMEKTTKKPFLYLIQDYETNFFPGSSLYALADASYLMNYAALFSSRALQQAFVTNNYGAFGSHSINYTYFNNACASTLLNKTEFISPKTERRFVLYSRPVVHRNMFELAALALCEAVKKGVFEADWAFYGIGLGDAVIRFEDGRALKQLPRMNLRDYQAMMAGFDLGLSLMASPHPSLLPFELGGSGAIVVTNTFGTKDQQYFDTLCKNVIARPPRLTDLVEGLEDGAARTLDRHARYDAALQMAYPREWSQTFGDEHRSFVKNCFG